MEDDYKARTIQAYEAHPDVFAEKFRQLMSLPERKEFDTFLNLLHGNKVLDIGAGAGDHAAFFSDKGLDVTCVDISPSMVERCKQKGLTAKVMDAEKIDFPDQSFNGVWAVSSLLHIPKKDLPGVALNIHRILKENGLLYVCMKQGRGERMVQDPHDPNQERYFSFWQDDELTEVFSDLTLIDDEHVEYKGTTYLKQFYRKTQ